MTDSPTALILGATSDIARALARTYAAHGYRLILACRQPQTLMRDVEDLKVRHHAQVETRAFDILDRTSQQALLAEQLPDVVLCVLGFMGVQEHSERDPALAETVMRTNYLEPAVLLGSFANQMEARGSGILIGISSVAGDRGRASNYLYGSAKAGFTAFLSGLRNRLAKKGVRVMTVKPGFVRTRMTEGMKLPARLTAEPQEVAEAVWKAQEKGRDILYVKGVWRFIMLIILHLPEFIFKRTKL